MMYSDLHSEHEGELQRITRRYHDDVLAARRRYQHLITRWVFSRGSSLPDPFKYLNDRFRVWVTSNDLVLLRAPNGIEALMDEPSSQRFIQQLIDFGTFGWVKSSSDGDQGDEYELTSDGRSLINQAMMGDWR